MKNRKKIVLFTLFVMNLVDQPAPEVQIEQGTLSGKISGDGSYFEYIGIPYATAERFKAPQPSPRWNGVYRAVEENYHCPQNTPLGVLGTEDCLKINVYVPTKTRAPKPLPVMVYVHGGGFILGSGGKMVYAPGFIVQRDVILVTFNYRLGILGFLCLGIKEAPGNAGMKDQVAALKWVQKNIAAFGGDPNNVTIFGHSAGGTSVGLHLATDAAAGLFHRAMVLSGSSLTNWAMSRDPVAVANKIAKLLGHDIKDPKQLYDLFSKTSYKDLITVTSKIPMITQFNLGYMNLPCIEATHSEEDEPFLTDYPYNLLTKKKPKNISAVYGFTDQEGSFFVAEDLETTLDLYKNGRPPFEDDLAMQSKEEESKVVRELKQFYFGDKDIDRQTVANLSDLYSDLHFVMPMLIEAEVLAKSNNAPIYNFYFSYSGGRNLVKGQYGLQKEPGACHADDILYMFDGKMWPFKITEEDQKMIDWMTDMITNFAKYGHPTPNNTPIQWLPNEKEKLSFLYIDEELKMGSTPKPEAVKIWKRLYNEYRKLNS